MCLQMCHATRLQTGKNLYIMLYHCINIFRSLNFHQSTQKVLKVVAVHKVSLVKWVHPDQIVPSPVHKVHPDVTVQSENQVHKVHLVCQLNVLNQPTSQHHQPVHKVIWVHQVAQE